MNENLLAEAREALKAAPKATAIDAIFPDLCGLFRGKRLPLDDLERLCGPGLQLPGSSCLLDVRGEDTNAAGLSLAAGDPDVCARPVAGGFAPVPWQDPAGVQVLLTFNDLNGAPFIYDPRVVLERVVARLAKDGFRPVVAFELEFYLLRPERDAEGAPIQHRALPLGRRGAGGQVYGMADLEHAAPLLAEIAETCAAQSIPTGAINAEYGIGQFEINLRHVDDPMRAADHCALFRRVAKAVARRHGLEATFMSKPFLDQPGSGMHIHISLLDEDGGNIFAGEDALGSEALRHAAGGMLRTAPGAMAFYAPNINAFRRFKANDNAPVTRSWGANNRSASLRVPAGPAEARRIEHRFAGADANGYLVLAAALAGLHHGLDAKVDPGPPAVGNAGRVCDPDLPLNWAAALDALSGAAILKEYLGAAYTDAYVATKRHERAGYNAFISAREYEWYLLTD